jgi:hypothetical protein
MATDKQIRANRLNAQRSTGPSTPEGKARSRQNALAHGLTARTVLVMGESREDYERLREGIWLEYQPKGTIEEEFAERLVSLLWRVRRIPAFESALLLWQNRASACLFDDSVTNDLLPIPSPHAIPEPDDDAGEEELDRHDRFVLGRTLEQMIRKGDLLTKIASYEASLVRQLDKTLARLEDLIRQRTESEKRREADDVLALEDGNATSRTGAGIDDAYGIA